MYQMTLPFAMQLQELSERIRLPDGLICPWCGERERLTPVFARGLARLRYECTSCGEHAGFIRAS